MAKKIIIDSELLEASNAELKEYANNAIDELSEKVINKPDTAEVGQVIAVKAVDENGKPTEFEAINNTAGYTPVKGTDYYTEADKTEMVNTVLAALPAAEGGSF